MSLEESHMRPIISWIFEIVAGWSQKKRTADSRRSNTAAGLGSPFKITGGRGDWEWMTSCWKLVTRGYRCKKNHSVKLLRSNFHTINLLCSKIHAEAAAEAALRLAHPMHVATEWDLLGQMLQSFGKIRPYSSTLMLGALRTESGRIN